jgi:uncharacterized protein involved in exopolysaccharide biosynthesis
MYSELQISNLKENISKVLFYLLSKWLQIFTISLLFSMSFVIYIWLQEPKYTAEITFVSENDKSSGISAYAGIAAQFGIDINSGGGGVFEGDNLIGLLQSKKLIDKTLLSNIANSKELIIERYISNHKLFGKETNNLKSSSINFDTSRNNNNRLEDSIINIICKQILEKRLTVGKPEKKQDIISIKYIDNDEVLAKQFVENLANNAIKFYTEYKSKKSSGSVAILQKQTDSIRHILFGGISDAASLNDLNVNPLKQSQKINTQKKQIDIQVNSVLYGELIKNLELAKLALRKETPLIQIIDTPILPLKNEKMGRLTAGILGAFIGGFISILFLSISIIYKLQFITIQREN